MTDPVPVVAAVAGHRPYTAVADRLTADIISNAINEVSNTSASTQPSDPESYTADTTPSTQHITAEQTVTDMHQAATAKSAAVDTRPYTAVADRLAEMSIAAAVHDNTNNIDHLTADPHTTTTTAETTDDDLVADTAADDSNTQGTPAFDSAEDSTPSAMLQRGTADIDQALIAHLLAAQHDTADATSTTVDDVSAAGKRTESVEVDLASDSTAHLYNHTRELPPASTVDVISHSTPATDDVDNDNISTTAEASTADDDAADDAADDDTRTDDTGADAENVDLSNEQSEQTTDTAMPAKPMSLSKQIAAAKAELKALVRINTQRLQTIRTLTQQRIDLDQQLKYVQNISTGLVKMPQVYDQKRVHDYNASLKQRVDEQRQQIEELKAQIFVLKRKSGSVEQVLASTRTV